jgi:hypothetical protein
VGALLVAHGTGEEGVREVIRWTARSSLLLLCTALVADGVRGAFFGWRHWDDVLRSLGLSHGVHGVAVLALAAYTHGQNLTDRSAPLLVFGGSLAYVFIILGTFRPRARVLSFGLFWIWGVFLVGYGTRAMRMPMPYGFALALLILVLLVRVGALIKSWLGAASASDVGGVRSEEAG